MMIIHLPINLGFILGAWVFIQLENGRELEEKAAKEDKTQVFISIS